MEGQAKGVASSVPLSIPAWPMLGGHSKACLSLGLQERLCSPVASPLPGCKVARGKLALS